MAKKFFTDQSLSTLVSEIKSYTDSAVDDSKAFYVTVTTEDFQTGTADKTFSEIFAAYNNGKVVYCKVMADGLLIFPLTMISGDGAVFTAVAGAGIALIIIITADNSVSISLTETPTLEQLTEHAYDWNIHVSSTNKTNWDKAYTHSQATHAPTNAQPNQNAFSNIAVSGQTTVAADTTTDTVTFAGSNVSITTDATNDKVTFSVADGSTSGKGVVQLTNSTSSTSTTTAATPSSVKSAYDLANTAKTNAATAQTRADAAYSLAEGKVDSLSDLGITATAAELNYVDGVTSNIQTQLDGKSESGHTHNYAGSSSIGGAATSANKLNTDAGGATQPVYFANGIPVKTTYTLGKSVPSDAKFTDTTYGVATTSANGLMSSTDKTKLNATNVAYGTCATAAGTAAKVVTLSGNTNWTLTTGSIIMVKFDNSNTASSVTLNVNSTGAYPIWYNNAEYTSNGTAYTGYAGRVTTYMFNGTHYVWVANSYDSNTTYTNVKLGHGYATCSTAEATVAKAATLSSYTLTTGGIVAVKFTNAVPASATLNVNSKGAKAIYHKGAAIAANVIKAGDTATFIYNGSQYHLLAIDRDENSTYSLSSFGITATAAELNKLDGVTATATEINYIDGVTSNIQTQLDSKQATISGGASTIASSNLTASRALISNSSGKVAVSDVTSTELGYLDGVTSAIQTQLDGKVPTSRTVNGKALSANISLTASDVGAASSSHSHSASNITSGILSVERGGTGNSSGYVRAGQLSGSSIGTMATAEGRNTTASGDYSHVEGNYSEATGSSSHAEGQNTVASGAMSHAEGENTEAIGKCSHAEGQSTIANGDYCHVQGKYNVEDTNGTYAHIIGGGSSTSSRANIHTVDWNGNAWYKGNVSVSTTKGLTRSDGKYLVYNDETNNNIQIGGLSSSHISGQVMVVADKGLRVDRGGAIIVGSQIVPAGTPNGLTTEATSTPVYMLVNNANTDLQLGGVSNALNSLSGAVQVYATSGLEVKRGNLTVDNTLTVGAGNISHVGTKLWSGTWSSGTITVNGFNNYTLFLFYPSDSSSAILVTRRGTSLRGGTLFPTAANNLYMDVFTGTCTTAINSTLTYTACMQKLINSNNAVSTAKTTPIAISEIYGVI